MQSNAKKKVGISFRQLFAKICKLSKSRLHPAWSTSRSPEVQETSPYNLETLCETGNYLTLKLIGINTARPGNWSNTMRGNFKHSNIDGCILHQVQREREGRKPRNHGSKNSNLTSSTPPEIEHTTSRCPSYGDVVPNENKWPTSRKSVRRLLSVCAAVGVHFIVSLWDWSFRRPNQLFSSTCSSTFLFHLKFQSLQ